jgi:two-component system sensor histidine kinase RegB
MGIPSNTLSQESIQLAWFVRIRWAAIVSLLVIFCGGDYLLDLDLSWMAVASILSLSALLNVVLLFREGDEGASNITIAGLALMCDVLVLAALLYLCGGYTNPFSMMFLVYVTLAAFFLSAAWTWGVFGLSLLSFTALFFLHVPVPQLGMHAHHGHHSGFSLHLHGMFLAFCLIGFITAWFVTRMNREMSAQARRIRELQRAQDDRNKLMSLATLTAGAAHELATPLATLSLIGDDLRAAFAEDARWREDVQVMTTELDRCAAILHRMRANSTELSGEAPSTFRVSDVVAEVASEFANVEIVQFPQLSSENDAVRSLRQSLVSSLCALVRNGVQACAAKGHVCCGVGVDETSVTFSVSDSGMGMSQEVQERAGEPFFTSKEPGQGMGLGLYLTKLFVLQVGGSLRISSELGQGTTVTLRIPRGMKV